MRGRVRKEVGEERGREEVDKKQRNGMRGG